SFAPILGFAMHNTVYRQFSDDMEFK
ncbi:MAG: hypothetical protein DFNUSKGM_003192, partial [Candidatus Fervidibacter sacchari]